jgi:hypothetical protein
MSDPGDVTTYVEALLREADYQLQLMDAALEQEGWLPRSAWMCRRQFARDARRHRNAARQALDAVDRLKKEGRYA